MRPGLQRNLGSNSRCRSPLHVVPCSQHSGTNAAAERAAPTNTTVPGLSETDVKLDSPSSPFPEALPGTTFSRTEHDGHDEARLAGTVTAVQPRISLWRSFDERSHTYLGYVLRVFGEVDDAPAEFAVAIGPGAQEKHQLRAGCDVSGLAELVPNPQQEEADYYKVSKLKVLFRHPASTIAPPPWLDVAPPIATYRQRGHRRLDKRTFETKACSSCMWGCRMPVEITVDKWKPYWARHRRETFCYGPLSCPIYNAGPTRKVTGRLGDVYEELDWLDQQGVGQRGPDE